MICMVNGLNDLLLTEVDCRVFLAALD